jgi:hypothetical protein
MLIVMSEPAAQYRVPGRPSVVSQWQVDKACDAMLVKGERPTIEKVRQATGGSPNSLLKLVDDWWRRLGERVDRGESPAFERLPSTLALHAEAFFYAALDEARAVARSEKSKSAATNDDEKLKEQLTVRAHALSLREKEFAAKAEQRERSTAVLEEALRDKRTLLEKTLASKDALQRQVDELRIVVATLQAKHATALATPRARAIPRKPRSTLPARKARKVVRARKARKSSPRRAHRGRR